MNIPPRKRLLQLLFCLTLFNLGVVIYVSNSLPTDGQPARRKHPQTVSRHFVVTPRPDDLQPICDVIMRHFPTWSILTYGKNDVAILTCTKGERKLRFIRKSTEFWWANEDEYLLQDGRGRAYITAIAKGALAIYVTEDIARIGHVRHRPFDDSATYTGLVHYGRADDFSPTAHFGCQRNSSMSRTYRMCTSPAAALQANGYHFVRHTYVTGRRQEQCVSGVPPIVAERYENPLPIDVTDAIYSREAFWALPFSSFDSSIDKRLWAYFVQKALMELGHLVKVTSLSRKEVAEKEPLAISQEQLRAVDRLVPGFAGRARSLVMSFHTILSKMRVQSLLSEACIQPQVEWIKTMGRIEESTWLWHRKDRIMPNCANNVTFYPWEPLPTESNIQNMAAINKTYHSLCKNSDPNRTQPLRLDRPWRHFSNIALVITYNNPIDEVIPYVETLYRPFFPILVHCSPPMTNRSWKSRSKRAQHQGWEFIFVEYKTATLLPYECIRLVLNLRLPVDGFLFLSDDVTFSVRDVPSFPVDRAWMYRPSRACDANNVTSCKQWTPYGDDSRDAMKAVFRDLRLARSIPLVGFCLSKLRRLGRPQSDWFLGGLSDVFYLPHSKALELNLFLPIFLKHNVFHEVTIPTLLFCTNRVKGAIHNLKGNYRWGPSRNFFGHFFASIKEGNATFLHPTKWSPLYQGMPKSVDSYCNDILPFMYNITTVPRNSLD